MMAPRANSVLPAPRTHEMTLHLTDLDFYGFQSLSSFPVVVVVVVVVAVAVDVVVAIVFDVVRGIIVTRTFTQGLL
jgi:hypothetical protein